MTQLRTVPEFRYQDLSSLELKQALEELDGLDKTNRIPDDGIIRKSIYRLVGRFKFAEHYALRLPQEYDGTGRCFFCSGREGGDYVAPSKEEKDV